MVHPRNRAERVPGDLKQVSIVVEWLVLSLVKKASGSNPGRGLVVCSLHV